MFFKYNTYEAMLSVTDQIRPPPPHYTLSMRPHVRDPVIYILHEQSCTSWPFTTTILLDQYERHTCLYKQDVYFTLYFPIIWGGISGFRVRTNNTFSIYFEHIKMDYDLIWYD